MTDTAQSFEAIPDPDSILYEDVSGRFAATLQTQSFDLAGMHLHRGFTEAANDGAPPQFNARADMTPQDLIRGQTL